MNEKFHEELSALMDGELSELELRRVLKQCAEEPAHMGQWYRMHRVRSVLRGEHREPGMCLTSLDLTARVSAALAEEAAHEAVALTASGQAPVRSTARWHDTFIKPLASVAVAASVSAMVVVGWQSVNGVPGAPGTSAVVQSGTPSTTLISQTHNVRGGGAMPVAEFQSVNRSPARITGSPDMEIIRIDDQGYNERLRRYLISHSGNAAQHTASGTYSYARAVSLKPATGTPAAGAPATVQP